jgi:hypothetical protein
MISLETKGLGTKVYKQDTGKYYKENVFLRNIKANYLEYHSLTENQVSAFEKVVVEVKVQK